ncbi:MAG: YciI family protein [Blastocatellia bacterium]|nr:YciI family protein [Blastocatellia bacterium]
MTFGKILSLSLLLFLGGIALVGSTPPREARAQESPQAASKPPQFDLEAYQFGFLRKGPNHGTGTKEEADKVQAGHMANIQKMGRSGKLMAAGPMGDDGNLRGIFLFKASAEEAKAMAAEDPAIQAGRLVLDLHAWQGPKGIGAKLMDEFRKDPNVKMTMTRYFLALLTREPKAPPAADMRKLELDHLWSVRRMLDAKKFVAAGPFNAGDLRGLFVITAASLEEAKAIVDADPAVKAGQLRVELHPWWVAKEVWP